jgi:hypothetical protein
MQNKESIIDVSKKLLSIILATWSPSEKSRDEFEKTLVKSGMEVFRFKDHGIPQAWGFLEEQEEISKRADAIPVFLAREGGRSIYALVPNELASKMLVLGCLPTDDLK